MIQYDPNDYPLPLTEAQQEALLAMGQAEVDAQILELLISGGPMAQAYIDVAMQYGRSLEDVAAELLDW